MKKENKGFRVLWKIQMEKNCDFWIFWNRRKRYAKKKKGFCKRAFSSQILLLLLKSLQFITQQDFTSFLCLNHFFNFNFSSFHFFILTQNFSSKWTDSFIRYLKNLQFFSLIKENNFKWFVCSFNQLAKN